MNKIIANANQNSYNRHFCLSAAFGKYKKVAEIIESPSDFSIITARCLDKSFRNASENGYAKIVAEIIESPRFCEVSERKLKLAFRKAAVNGHAQVVDKIISSNRSNELTVEDLNWAFWNAAKNAEDYEPAKAASKIKKIIQITEYLTDLNTEYLTDLNIVKIPNIPKPILLGLGDEESEEKYKANQKILRKGGVSAVIAQNKTFGVLCSVSKSVIIHGIHTKAEENRLPGRVQMKIAAMLGIRDFALALANKKAADNPEADAFVLGIGHNGYKPRDRSSDG